MEEFLRRKEFAAFVEKVHEMPVKRKQNTLHSLFLCFMNDTKNDDQLFLTDVEVLTVIEMIKNVD